jgi:hypothetical protein
MGGIGSGRPKYGGKLTTAQCLVLDLNHLNASGYCSSAKSGSWVWSRGGEQISSIGVTGGRNRITLTYRHRQQGGDWQDVTEPIEIQWQPCNLGGERPFFICPGVVIGRVCNRRAAKLYSAGRYYLCRHCYRLSYACQGESPSDRAMRRATKIRHRLGGGSGFMHGFPKRPKGMWSRTYDRLSTKGRRVEIAMWKYTEELVDRIHLADSRSATIRKRPHKKGHFEP